MTDKTSVIPVQMRQSIPVQMKNISQSGSTLPNTPTHIPHYLHSYVSQFKIVPASLCFEYWYLAVVSAVLLYLK